MPLKDAAAIDKNFLIPNHLLKEENKPLPLLKKTYNNAIKSGDKLVRLISGKQMLKSVKNTAFADNIHPGDSGFISMASHITKELKLLLKQ